MSATQHDKGKQKRPIVSGFILLGIGLFFLFLTEGILPPIEYSWPVIIIIAGLALILGTVFRKKKPGGDEFHRNLSQ